MRIRHPGRHATGATISERTIDLATTKGPILWNEIMRRQWSDGKVVSERYYTAA